MASEDDLRAKLSRVEALFAGATTTGEKEAAGAAAERIRARLREMEVVEPPTEVRFSLLDPWSRRLFIALCRRYDLKPYRYARMQRQTVIVKAPRRFLETVLWPEFTKVNAGLTSLLGEITNRVIQEEVHGEGDGAEERPNPPAIGRV